MNIRPAYRFGRFVGFSLHNGKEPLGKAFPLYKHAALALVAFALTGCSMTPAQQKWAAIGASVVIVGAMAAHEADSGKALEHRIMTPRVNCETGACR